MKPISSITPGDRWSLAGPTAIVWEVASDQRLPHGDHIEMSGRAVSVIVTYSVDAAGRLSLSRDVIWPTLRTRPGYERGYLRREYGDATAPALSVEGIPYDLPPVERVRYDGILRFEHAAAAGIAVERALFPSPGQAAVLEVWTVRNDAEAPVAIAVDPHKQTEGDRGVYGEYEIRTSVSGLAMTLAPGEAATVALAISARRILMDLAEIDPGRVREERERFALRQFQELEMRTADPVIDCLFAFAKLRAAESVFETAMGLVHSPGGGNFYGGIWANDQAEYSGPFFPYLGDETANAAALNAYRIFAAAMTPEYRPIPSSYEVEGDLVMTAFGDRGDAAMFAYGASHFALAAGDPAVLEELWPAIQWCLEYCRRKTNAEGVVESDTDELEGRFPAGDANLSTSALTYGGLLGAARIASALEDGALADLYTRRADALRGAIERHFGADIEGYHAYRYYAGNATLRSWICLPLVMGIFDRAQGTIAALLSDRLWTPYGLATESGIDAAWDRETLYALRGFFLAGECDRGASELADYARQRLLGEHVPFPCEAYPENNQAHLSAESALFCRIILEGMLEIVPTGLRSFTCTPHLPAALPSVRLSRIHAFGTVFDLNAALHGDDVSVSLHVVGHDAREYVAKAGETLSITLPT